MNNMPIYLSENVFVFVTQKDSQFLIFSNHVKKLNSRKTHKIPFKWKIFLFPFVSDDVN